MACGCVHGVRISTARIVARLQSQDSQLPVLLRLIALVSKDLILPPTIPDTTRRLPEQNLRFAACHDFRLDSMSDLQYPLASGRQRLAPSVAMPTLRHLADISGGSGDICRRRFRRAGALF